MRKSLLNFLTIKIKTIYCRNVLNILQKRTLINLLTICFFNRNIF